MMECKGPNVFAVSSTLSLVVHTMKMDGCMQGATILLLIDNNATHNCISHIVVESLGLPVVPFTPLGVKLSDGYMALTMGRSNKVQMLLGEIQVVLDAMC